MRGKGFCGWIFVCEGVDDKKVYFHWLKSLGVFGGYEFYVCNGKRQVLQFRELLSRDLSGLRKGVSYIVDRDFDGLQGYPFSDDIYVTDSYSFENSLVSCDVLDVLLSTDMHCNGLPEVRALIIERFGYVYSKFLEITRPHNQRLHLARTLGIPVRPLSDKLSVIASVGLLDVEPSPTQVEVAVHLECEPDLCDKERCAEEFCKLDPVSDYRGKYALSFFLRWLDLLAEDRRSGCGVLFSTVSKASASINGAFGIDSLASKSRPPSSFCRFVGNLNLIH